MRSDTPRGRTARSILGPMGMIGGNYDVGLAITLDSDTRLCGEARCRDQKTSDQRNTSDKLFDETKHFLLLLFCVRI